MSDSKATEKLSVPLKDDWKSRLRELIMYLQNMGLIIIRKFKYGVEEFHLKFDNYII